MNAELQSWAAGAIVLATVAIFLSRAVKSRRVKKGAGGGCGSGCGCSSGVSKSTKA